MDKGYLAGVNEGIIEKIIIVEKNILKKKQAPKA
jgi:hypothetical protein